MNIDEKDFFDGHFGVWRTVGGRRIFIRDDESLEDAMKRSGKFGNNNDNLIECEKEFREMIKHPNPEVIEYEAGKKDDQYFKDLATAQFLKEEFNAKIKLLKAINEHRMPDSLVNDKYYWEFKGFSGETSLENQIRDANRQFKAVKAVDGNAILLLQSKSILDYDTAWKVINEQLDKHVRYDLYLVYQDKDILEFKKYIYKK